MQIADFEIVLRQVFGEVFGHFLGQRGDEHPALLCHNLAAFGHEVVDLMRGRADFHRRINEAGGADDLFGDFVVSDLFELPWRRGGGDEDGLAAHCAPFLEFQRAVVDGGGQAEAVLDQCALAFGIAGIHGAQLRHHDVAFIEEHERVIGEVFDEGRRRIAGRAAGEIARVIFNAGAHAGGGQHFKIEAGALVEALGLQELVLGFELREAGFEIGFDLLDRLLDRRAGRDVVGIGENAHAFEVVEFLAGERVEFCNFFDLVAEEGKAPGAVVHMRGEELDGVASDSKCSALEGDVVAGVGERDEALYEFLAVDALVLVEVDRHGEVVFLGADAVDAGDGRDDDAIAALKQRARGGVAHAVDLLVDGAVFFDEGVGAWDVGFGLVVIVIGDEIFDGVVWEELFHLAVELRRQGFVGGKNERRALGLFDDLRHGEGLAGASDAEKNLVRQAVRKASHELFDGRGLVAGGFEIRDDLEGLRRITPRHFVFIVL